jgi:hypothetical protein
MGYCSLEEAWGENFASDSNNSNYVINNIEPMTDISSPQPTYNNVAQGIEVQNNIVPVMMNQNNIPEHITNNNTNIINQSQLQQQQSQNITPQQTVVNTNSSVDNLYKIINQLRKENYELKLQLKNKFNINFDNLPEIFLYGILIFLVIDVLFGFRRK